MFFANQGRRESPGQRHHLGRADRRASQCARPPVELDQGDADGPPSAHGVVAGERACAEVAADRRLRKHYTDTYGSTKQLFGLSNLLGIVDLGETVVLCA